MRALAAAGVSPAELDAIVLATASPDRLLPSTACDLQALLGADNAAAFDIGAACPGLRVRADRGGGPHRVGAEPDRARGRGGEALDHHRFPGSLDRHPVRRRRGRLDRAAVDARRDAGSSPPSSSPTAGSRRCSTGRAAASADPISEKVVCERSHYMKMAGPRGVQGRRARHGRRLRRSAPAGGRHRRTRSTCWCRTRPTSGSSRPRPSTPGIPMSKVMVNVDRYGNTSSASIPLALEQARGRGPGRAGLGRPAGRVRRGLHLGQRGDPVVSVLMCPGQGAQRVGMGRDLAERFPAARDTFAAIDDALGVALSRLMWEGPEDELTLTHNTQPAILAHSVGGVGRRAGPPGATSAAAAGHSLGEYSALRRRRHPHADRRPRSLVRRRGELMYAAGRGAAGRHGRGARARRRRRWTRPATRRPDRTAWRWRPTSTRPTRP